MTQKSLAEMIAEAAEEVHPRRSYQLQEAAVDGAAKQTVETAYYAVLDLVMMLPYGKERDQESSGATITTTIQFSRGTFTIKLQNKPQGGFMARVARIGTVSDRRERGMKNVKGEDAKDLVTNIRLALYALADEEE